MSYKSAVGPRGRWDLVSGHVFCVMIERGLREGHKVLDIGCGSMRNGRLLIAYLEKEMYFGFDPRERSIKMGLKNEVGSLETIKKAKVMVCDHIPEDWMSIKFDYILAQSIFTHAPIPMIERYLAESAEILNPGGLLLATFVQGDEPYRGDKWVGGPARYPRDFLEHMAQLVGLEPLPNSDEETWHPGNHDWMVCRQPRGGK